MSYRQSGLSRPRSSGSFRSNRSFGGGRGFSGGNRGGGRGNRFMPKSGNINPARYVNAATQAVNQEEFISEHQFSDFGLDPRILANIAAHGYTSPTEIQDKGIPVVMSGKDFVGIANTGTGKTAAFLLPFMNKLLLDDKQGVLIIVPTRELATQIADEFIDLAKGLPLTMAVCVGGMNIETQIRNVRKDPHFVIGTPGRLKDLINRRAYHPEMYTNIVLDEVDRMLDIGFIHDIQFIISYLPAEKHSCFFSATITRDAEMIMHTLLKDPAIVNVKRHETNAHIDQNVIRIQPGQHKVEVLFSLLQQEEFERVIVFGRTKHGINKLEEVLSTRGIRVSSIHGNKSQNARQYALDQFKKGRTRALLATDVAARGIDIPNVSHVINFDEPASYDDYIHRIGRTGRAGKVGKALTFLG